MPEFLSGCASRHNSEHEFTGKNFPVNIRCEAIKRGAIASALLFVEKLYDVVADEGGTGDFPVAETSPHSGSVLKNEFFMSNESTGNSPAPPRCPSCAQPMQLIKRTPRFDELPELFTFSCRTCGVAHTEARHDNR